MVINVTITADQDGQQQHRARTLQFRVVDTDYPLSMMPSCCYVIQHEPAVDEDVKKKKPARRAHSIVAITDYAHADKTGIATKLVADWMAAGYSVVEELPTVPSMSKDRHTGPRPSTGQLAVQTWIDRLIVNLGRL